MEGYRSAKVVSRGQTQKSSKFTSSSVSSSLSSSTKHGPSRGTSSRFRQQSPSPDWRSSPKGSSSDGAKDRGRAKRPKTTKKGDNKTVKNPDLIQGEKGVDNEDLINGLALQRQWDEKPDIDHLSTSLLHLYHKRETGEESSLGELRAKIFLSSLRVRSKSASFFNFTNSRMKSVVKFCRFLGLKRNTLNKNLPRVERHYLDLCRFHQRQRSLNEVYERLSRTVSKLPGVAEVEATSNELVEKKLSTLSKMEKIRAQVEAQKSQINEISQLLNDLTGSQS